MSSERYLVLDCETATLPFVKEWKLSPKEKQKISIAKPLIYDIGWTVTDRYGNIIKRASYLVQETFFVPGIFNTAYYREKRPSYMEKFRKGEIIAKLWEDIAKELLEDCQKVDRVAAYNAMFDFCKAIPFTERYFAALYSDKYNEWEYGQRKACEELLKTTTKKKDEKVGIDLNNFIFREYSFPMVDVWRVACVQLVNKWAYKNICTNFPMVTNSGRYFKTSAETVFRFLKDDYNFNEAHTALSDAEIETEILFKSIQEGNNIDVGILAFPFRELGTTCEFLCENMISCPSSLNPATVKNVLDIMESYCDTVDDIYTNTFAAHLMKEIRALEKLFNLVYFKREIYCPDFELMKEYRRKKRIYEKTEKLELRKQLLREMSDLAEEILDLQPFEKAALAEKAAPTEKVVKEERPRKKNLTAAKMMELAKEKDGLDWYCEMLERHKTIRKGQKGIVYEAVNYKEVREEFLAHFYPEDKEEK